MERGLGGEVLRRYLNLSDVPPSAVAKLATVAIFIAKIILQLFVG
jgi:hypothetical protein